MAAMRLHYFDWDSVPELRAFFDTEIPRICGQTANRINRLPAADGTLSGVDILPSDGDIVFLHTNNTRWAQFIALHSAIDFVLLSREPASLQAAVRNYEREMRRSPQNLHVCDCNVRALGHEASIPGSRVRQWLEESVAEEGPRDWGLLRSAAYPEALLSVYLLLTAESMRPEAESYVGVIPAEVWALAGAQFVEHGGTSGAISATGWAEPQTRDVREICGVAIGAVLRRIEGK